MFIFSSLNPSTPLGSGHLSSRHIIVAYGEPLKAFKQGQTWSVLWFCKIIHVNARQRGATLKIGQVYEQEMQRPEPGQWLGMDRWGRLQRSHTCKKKLEWWKEDLEAVQGSFPGSTPFLLSWYITRASFSSVVQQGYQQLHCLPYLIVRT